MTDKEIEVLCAEAVHYMADSMKDWKHNLLHAAVSLHSQHPHSKIEVIARMDGEEIDRVDVG